MRRVWFFAPVLGVILLAGCGGGSGSGGPSAFMGTWNGTLTGTDSTGAAVQLAVAMTVDTTGKIVGAATDNTSLNDAVSGTISKGGTLALSFLLPNGTLDATAKGATTIAPAGDWRGPLTIGANNTSTTVLFDASRQ
ncbi:MAG: hypothetical protein ACR2PL_11105 [Dehalococcoidia bacterium]